MAFVLPQFNLSVDLYTGPWLGKVFRVSVMGNFAFSRRVQQQGQSFPDSSATKGSSQSILLLPPLTDIRGGVLSGPNDVIELPSGSGRWYQVFLVEDIGKGFPNEHRAAVVFQISSQANAIDYAGCVWPVPMT